MRHIRPVGFVLSLLIVCAQAGTENVTTGPDSGGPGIVYLVSRAGC